MHSGNGCLETQSDTNPNSSAASLIVIIIEWMWLVEPVRSNVQKFPTELCPNGSIELIHGGK